MKNNNTFTSIISTILSCVGLLFFLFISTQCQNVNERFSFQSKAEMKTQTAHLKQWNEAKEKQKGAHVFGRIDTANFQFLTRNNIEWITLVPWGFQEDIDSPRMNHHNGDTLQMLQRDSNLVRKISSVRSAGFNVFLKPHIWIDAPSDGKWRSDIYPEKEADWELWKSSYRDFILRYANLAEQAHVEMFCIGTELSRLSMEKPTFWKALIAEVRGIYKGKITYAANWYQEYEGIRFWDDLDYIGIQAYFPLVKKEHPSVEEISKGWNNYLTTLASIHKKYDRKILFTEMGYKSTADSAIKPWEWIEHPHNSAKTISTETQANCYAAFFNTVWPNDWFAGVHLWQLRWDHSQRVDAMTDLDFTPLGKPAEQIMAKGFESLSDR